MNPKQTLTRSVLSAITLVVAVGGSACGAAVPPPQILNARAAYAAAAAGPAATLTPAELVDARQALDEAERRLEKHGATDATLDAGYIAQRRAEIADARGRIAEAEAAQVRGATTLAELRESQQGATERALVATQGEVERTGRELVATGAELRATDRALTEERQGRADAERRTKEAIAKLALAAALTVKEEPRGTVITLPSNVLFATGKHELLPGAMSKLDAVAIALKDQRDVSILVEGHTDSQGTPEDNRALAKRRGESVRTYLLSKGIPAEQLTSVGIGEERPIGDNQTTDGRSQNRRVEIVVTPREKR